MDTAKEKKVNDKIVIKANGTIRGRVVEFKENNTDDSEPQDSDSKHEDDK